MTKANTISLDEVLIRSARTMKKSNSFSIRITNPKVTQFTILRLKWVLAPKTDQFFRIYNEDGKLMQQGMIILKKGVVETEFKLDYLASGFAEGFTIIITDSESRESKTFTLQN